LHGGVDAERDGTVLGGEVAGLEAESDRAGEGFEGMEAGGFEEWKFVGLDVGGGVTEGDPGDVF
jgi:hypothetical protein